MPRQVAKTHKGTKFRHKGFIKAEDIIGVRNPRYDEDNIAFETAKLYYPPGILRSTQNIGHYEDASRNMILQGLAKIR